jgi:hypothetical protein
LHFDLSGKQIRVIAREPQIRALCQPGSLQGQQQSRSARTAHQPQEPGFSDKVIEQELHYWSDGDEDCDSILFACLTL